MNLHDPWRERRAGRPKRTTPFREATFRFTVEQWEALERLSARGVAGSAHGVAKLIFDKELTRLSEELR